jgi:hypothetical protein
MQTIYTLSQEDLKLIIADYFKQKEKSVKHITFYKTYIDRPGDIELTYASVSVEEPLLSVSNV